MDPLGQGVSREGKTVTFIAGTLPGETGTAVVYKKSKGVQFARLGSLGTSSANRCEPACPHFNECPGCHYLHTDYASELGYKKAALLRHLAKLKISEQCIELVRAPQRLAYRNRVQLHYRHKYIGMLDPINNKVLEVPHCQIIHKALQPALSSLYEDRTWAGEHAGHGHCELYVREGVVSVQWDGAYSHGGFSQVYDEMNRELQTRVQQQLQNCAATHVLDLFSGEGNLSNQFSASGGQRTLVDSYWNNEASPAPENFSKLDLYGENALRLFGRRQGKKSFDTVLLDPPRRGFPALDSWLKKIKPQYLLYVSCNPASLARDLATVSSKYQVVTVQLLDLFPGTYHFETLVLLRFAGKTA